MNEPILVVVAHPDDEVLGFGATAQRLTSDGIPVRACILSGDVGARHQRPSDAQLKSDTYEASRVVGMGEPIMGTFPNIRMNTVDHLELVQFVEAAMVEHGASRIVTHHPRDLNDDHRQVSSAAQAAARLSQRRAGMRPLKSLHYMEIPSSTDWAFAGADRFDPDSYFEVGEEGLLGKLKSLACYRDVMRPYPHPRSERAVRALATHRGAQAGLDLAEAFQTAHLDLKKVFG